jgi:hypothetical protein
MVIMLLVFSKKIKVKDMIIRNYKYGKPLGSFTVLNGNGVFYLYYGSSSNMNLMGTYSTMNQINEIVLAYMEKEEELADRENYRRYIK